jgi:phytoene synthase
MDDRLRESYRFCSQLSRREAKNFYWSFLLLPPARRRSMCALYAFMRHTDDLADEAGAASDKRISLNQWRADLDLALENDSDVWPGFRALADSARRHDVPRQYLHEVIDGVMMDLEPQPFATFDDLYAYCYRVASAVGLCCIHIWGYQSEAGRAEKLAESCGIALQLTNILRDVKEDACNGRVYLPREDLERFGVSANDLTADQPSSALRELLEFEGRRAYEYFELAAPLTRLVAPTGRPVLRAIVGIYRALLDEIAGRGYDVLTRRVSVPSWKKAAITVRSLVAS